MRPSYNEMKVLKIITIQLAIKAEYKLDFRDVGHTLTNFSSNNN